MKPHVPQGRSIFTTAIKGLSVVGGGVAAFLLTPGLHDWSVPMVQDFVALNYVAGWDGIVSALWFALVAALAFLASAALFSMGLMAAGLALASLLR